MQDLADIVNDKECEKSKAKGEKQGRVYYDVSTDNIISEAVDES